MVPNGEENEEEVNDGDDVDEERKCKEDVLQELERHSLDNDIVRVLLDNSITADEKCFQYHRCIENYLYKKDKKFKKIQYNFDVLTDANGQTTHVYVPLSQVNPVKRFLKKNTGAILGPVLGAALSNLYRLFIVYTSSLS